MDVFNSAELQNTDLVVERIYKGGHGSGFGDDPLPSLMGVSNQGGFRIRGTLDQPKYIVITSTLSDPDWPDNLDREAGVFTYYGDNKKPGSELHDTPRSGNLLLRNLFEAAHSPNLRADSVPPVFVFSSGGTGRDTLFLGLAVPGAPTLQASEDLVAIWRLKDGQRFQNYRSKFTILDEARISRRWINDLLEGKKFSENCPKAWLDWTRRGVFRPLKATRSIEYRSRDEQLPDSDDGLGVIDEIHSYFSARPTDFEPCAAKIAELIIGNVANIDVTQPSRDGGRDGVGLFRIGDADASVLVEFALEAKCYGLSNAVSVKDTSRLISRLRHRQFGILITTSYVGEQAYKEIKDDKHPVIIVSARDIVRALSSHGIVRRGQARSWLETNFARA